MPALTFKELKQNWDDGIEDDRYTINYNVKIDDSVRIEPYTVIEEDVEIGTGTIIGPFSQIRSNVKIGKNCRIGGHTTFESHPNYCIIIGNDVRIGSHVNLPYNVVIEDNVFLGNGTIIANDKSIDWPPTGSFRPAYAYVCKGAKIGINCTILPNLTIGENAVIGAGSVVTKSVLRNTTVYGNPAINWAKEKEERNKFNKELAEGLEEIKKELANLPTKLD